MNSEHHFARQNRSVLAIALVIGAFALAAGGCGKNEGKPAPAEQPVLNGSFPMAEPALSNAVIVGNLAEIRKIIDAGTDINAKDALDRTPLHMAAFYGQTKIIDLLVANGAEIDARDHTGMTPLHAAAISGGRQSVQLLLDRQADIQAKNGEGQTALHLAAATGQPKLTKFLIDRGADLQKKDSDGKTPLSYAKKNYHPQTPAVLEQAAAKKANAAPGPAAAAK